MKKAEIDFYCEYCDTRHVLIINLPFPVRVYCPCCGAHVDFNYDCDCIIIEEYEEKTNKKGVKNNDRKPVLIKRQMSKNPPNL